jgi:hypothetical protein
MAEKPTPSGTERQGPRAGPAEQDSTAETPPRGENAAKGGDTRSFVARVVADPAQVPGVWLLVGYLGDAPQPDQRRLYLTPDLSQWVDMAADALLHTAPVPGDWLGAVVAWVRQDAQLVAGNRWSTQTPR